MRAHLAALRARVDPIVKAWVGEVPATEAGVTVRPPFASVTGPSWGVPFDLPVAAVSDELDADVRVMVTAWSEAEVHNLLGQIRDDLSPDLTDTALVVPARSARVVFVRAEFVRVAMESPRDTATGRHMVTGIDTYRVVSQPA